MERQPRPASPSNSEHDERLDPRMEGPLGDYTIDQADQIEVPAHATGGPPRERELSVTPSEMGARALTEATGTDPGYEGDPDDVDPDTLSDEVQAYGD